MAVLPTGVVTFVLTDVVGSTELWDRVPTATDQALARHDGIVAAAVTANRGIVLLSKGEGDSTFSVFARASDALRAAYHLQRMMRLEPWPAGAEIRIRIGVDTGEAVERDGDYFGSTVNRVARLRSAARGGEVLVGAATATLVRRELPAGCELVDLGLFELRGLAHREHAFALAAGDLDLISRPPAHGDVAVSAFPASLELLADPSTFVGRSSEREMLRRRWQLARAGHTLLTLVTGEAGMGKSRLVAELAAEVYEEGGRVLLGSCYEDVDLAYGPFVEAISADASGLALAEVRRRVSAGDAVLARLAPELARAMPAAGSTHADAPGFDARQRGEMLAAIVGWLEATASTAPLLFVLEDLHWSTVSTRELLRHFVRVAGRRPLLLVATARDTAPDVDCDLDVLFGDLERAPAVTRVPLHGLDADEVAALTDVTDADAATIVAETGGNPLFVTHLTADGRPGSLPALLTRRDALLDAETRDLLDLAATLGSEFDAELLAAGSEVSPLTVLGALERAEAAGLVVARPGNGARFGFVHALFRSHRYTTLPVSRRLELHRRAAAALAQRSDDGRALSERARHACLAVPLGNARMAVDLSRDAAHEAEHAYAYDEAAAHYRRGLDAARSLEPPDRHATLDLTIRLAATLHRAGDPAGLPMLLDSAQRARQEGDGAALVRAAISFSPFGGNHETSTASRQLGAVIEDALGTLGDEPSAARARLLIELGSSIDAARRDDRLELARSAEAMALEVDDLDALAHVLLGARHFVYHPSSLEEYERIGVDLEHLGDRLPSVAVKLAGVASQITALLQRGDLVSWRREIDRFETLVGDRSFSYFQLDVLLHRAHRAFLIGDLQHAESIAMEMAPLARSTGREPASWAGAVRRLNYRLQGRDADLRAGLERLIAQRDFADYECLLAATQARSGAIEDALDTLARLRAGRFALTESYTWSLAMTDLAEAAEVAGDAETARHVLAACGRYAGRIAVAGTSVNRPFDQALAQAALAADDSPLAEHYATRAVAASRERQTPVFLCRELVFLAEARRRGGASNASLRPLVDEAVTISGDIGADIVRVDLERYGLRRS